MLEHLIDLEIERLRRLAREEGVTYWKPSESTRDYARDTIELRAYHEAGHTVAAIATYGLGIVERVSILEEGESGGRTILNLLPRIEMRPHVMPRSKAGPVEMPWAPRTTKPVWYWRRGKPVYRHKTLSPRALLEAYATHAWAGIAAEAQRIGVSGADCYDRALLSDLPSLLAFAQGVGVRLEAPRDARELENEPHWILYSRARSTLLRWWPAVEATVDALLNSQDGMLVLDEVDAVVLPHAPGAC